MSIVSVFVGLDYHQASIRVCVMDPQGRIQANFNCCSEVEEVIRRVGAHGKVHAAIESCSGAADFAEELIQRSGWIVDLAHPGYVSRMKQSPDKTDRTDAQLLADLVRVGYLPRVWLAPQEVRELRRLVRYRQQLADLRRATKLRICALLRDQRVRSPVGCRRWSKPWFAWLKSTNEISPQSRWIMDRHLEGLQSVDQEIKQVEERLVAVTAEDSVVAELSKRPGMGPVTAWTMRAEIGRFDRFRSGKQLARFCGLSPRNASSGERQADAGLIKAANPQLRAVLGDITKCCG